MRVNVQNTCPNDIIRALKTRKHKSGGPAAGNKNSGGEVMKKVLALLVSCTLALSLAGCSSQTDSGQTAEGSGKKVRIMIGYENNPGEPIDLACHEWKRLVEEKSGGTMRVDLYPSSQLGSKDNIIDQAVNGDCVVTLANGPFFQDRGIQDFGVLFAPYLFEGWEDLEKVVDSDWFEGKAEELEQNVGLKILTTWRYGIRHTITKKPVNGVSDLKGKKIRVPNQTILIKVFESLGATPTPMAMSDIYTALQQGVVDGEENPYQNLYVDKLCEVQKYCTETNHLFQMSVQVISKNFWDGLTPEDQEIFETLIAEAEEKGYERVNELNQFYKDECEKTGMQVRILTDEELAAFNTMMEESVHEKAVAIMGQDRWDKLNQYLSDQAAK